MALKIRWTENALEDYKRVVIYLLETWPVEVAEKFISNLETRLDTLSIFPKIGISSIRQDSIRSITLTKHNKLYYRINDDVIEILHIFDTRQQPSRNKYD
jgi:plasmid stabilization system protein ParE